MQNSTETTLDPYELVFVQLVSEWRPFWNKVYNDSLFKSGAMWVGHHNLLCAPSSHRRPFSYHPKMADFEYFRVLSVFSWKKLPLTQKSVLNMSSSDSQIDKPQRGRRELLDVNINTGAQSINTEKAFLRVVRYQMNTKANETPLRCTVLN